MKKCCRCGEEKPLTEFHKNKSTHDGLQRTCKMCCKLLKKEYHQTKQFKVYQQKRQQDKRAKTFQQKYRQNESNEIVAKVCSKCGEAKALNEFHKSTRAKDGHKSTCKICLSAQNKAYSQTEKAKAASRKYRESEQGKATRHACHQRYKETDEGKASIRFAQEKYKRTEKAKAKDRRYKKSEKARANARRCRQTEKVKATRQRYRQSEKGRLQRQKHWEKYPNQERAKRAVAYAVRVGKLPKVADLLCNECGLKAQVYHHSNYAREHWLSVTPLCRLCHAKVHRLMNEVAA